jgi:hypothetical protein
MNTLRKLLAHFVSTGDVDRARLMAIQIWHNRGGVFAHRWENGGQYQCARTGEPQILILDADGATSLVPESWFQDSPVATGDACHNHGAPDSYENWIDGCIAEFYGHGKGI